MKWLIPFFLFSSLSYAATFGPKAPTLGTNDASVGVTAWSNPGNVTASDVNYSTNVVSALLTSNYIVGSVFDFSACSAGSRVVGIAVHAEKTAPVPDTSGTRADSSIVLVVSGSTSTNKSGAGSWSQNKDYGSPTDTWGLSGITCGSLSTLQVKMSALNTDDIGGGTIGIGYMTVTIYTGSSQSAVDFDDIF